MHLPLAGLLAHYLKRSESSLKKFRRWIKTVDKTRRVLQIREPLATNGARPIVITSRSNS
ncbi:MAG: hypothetical protein DME40_00600 [Verrucomicrobia bacterium]|nr:MAG: hypothetical protein DME40_00600 [Verrucomicrobiota bacterium]